jgi:hypothetical protein
MPSRGANPARARSVFINCPFDPEYEPLLRAACFAIMACSHKPRCALDINDSGAVRFVEIVKLIAECGFSIHDISRVELDKASKLPRFNMPLELGADLGLRFAGSKPQRDRRMMIMDAEDHRYDNTLSDLSGNDIKAHAKDPKKVIRHVRDWLAHHWDPSLGKGPPGADYICADHDAFLTLAPDIVMGLNLDPHHRLPHRDYLRVVEEALPLIAVARGTVA